MTNPVDPKPNIGLRPLAWGRLYQRLDRAGPVLQEAVQGRRVWDLGAGTGAHADYLLDLGAASVVAVEKERAHWPDETRAGLEWRCTTFKELLLDLLTTREPIDVAFVAYPINYPVLGLIPLLQRARTVIYYGSNDMGTSCGWPELFRILLDRPVEAHLTWERPREALTVYGLPSLERRGPGQYTDEERFKLEVPDVIR